MSRSNSQSYLIDITEFEWLNKKCAEIRNFMDWGNTSIQRYTGSPIEAIEASRKLSRLDCLRKDLPSHVTTLMQNVYVKV